MICEWSSSRFPQNSFSPISFIIPFYSLFHPPFHPLSRPSPSSPLFPGFRCHLHACSLCIHSHLILPLNHFHHTHSYPFPFQSSHSIPLHHSHSFAIPFLTLHSHTFSGTFPLHYQAFILFSLIPTHFIDSYHSSFLFNVADLIHLISSLLILITSLYLLSFSINLDSILCSMYYDMSISYPYLSLITPLFFYSISFYSYSYPVSPIPIHFIGSHSSIRHRTQLLISIHFHLNTPSLLHSFILSLFYSSIHIVLSLIPSSLTTLLPSHSSSHHSSHSFLSTSSSLSHSILISSFILFHFNATLLSSSSSLFYKPLLDSILSLHSILLFVPIHHSIPILFLLLLTPLSTIILFHIHSRNIYSIHSLLSNPLTHSIYSYHLLLYHSYSFPYYLSLSITSSTISSTTSFSYFPLTSITLPSTNTTIKSLHSHILSTHSFFSSSSTTPSSSTTFQTLSAVLSHSLSHTLYYPPFSSPNTHRFFSYPIYNPSPLQSTLTSPPTSTSLYNPSSLHTPLRAIISISTDPTPSLFSPILLYTPLSLSTNGIPEISSLNSSKLNPIGNN